MITWLLVKLADVYSFIIVIYVLFTWFPVHRGTLYDIKNALAAICEPFLNIFRKIIPPIGGTIDVSPIAAILVLQLITRFLYWLL